VDAPISQVLISEEALQQRVRELGQQITAECAGLDMIAIGLLKGVVFFMADLLRNIDLPITIDFMAISTYGPPSPDTGVVRILKDLDESIEGRHVLLVEDVIDTGLTLAYILKTLRARNPASIRICALLNRPARRLVEIPVDYKGFDVPDVFVVGYGLDLGQRYRNLRYIGVLAPESLPQ
jgi:hypoxanthine phosphoribosyltransferase